MKLLLDANISRWLLSDIGELFPDSSHVALCIASHTSGFQPSVYHVDVERDQYPPMIRTIETAKILDTSVVEVRRLLREGKIFGFKLGEESAHDHWRVLTDSVFEYRNETLSDSSEGATVDDVE